MVDVAVDKLQTKSNKMWVGAAKYDPLIGMPFLKQQDAFIECGGLAIDFPKQGIRITAHLPAETSYQQYSLLKMLWTNILMYSLKLYQKD